MKNLIFLFTFGILLTACKTEVENESTSKNETTGLMVSDSNDKTPVYLDRIKLPPGYKIELYADEVDNARSLCMSPNGTLFVGTRSKGDVYALVDKDGDNKADEKYRLDKGLNMPNGVAFKDGDLY
ncbi:MAG: sorbosone dehydrogenase family protein, partial [Bacteroidia bacterium]|nr:sorbosone dehydrogenase family protein [Bacteroidia bacterium]